MTWWVHKNKGSQSSPKHSESRVQDAPFLSHSPSGNTEILHTKISESLVRWFETHSKRFRYHPPFICEESLFNETVEC